MADSKIDDKAVGGLSTAASNSLAYRIASIERHFFSGARWFEAAGTPSDTHKADRIGTVGGAGAFRIDAGNNTWGSWVQILGSDDTPIRTNWAYFEPSQIIVENTETAATYFVQITRGASGEAGYSAGNYSEFIYSATVQKDTGVVTVQTGRAPAGSLLWARCMAPGENTATFDFYLGIIEYEG